LSLQRTACRDSVGLTLLEIVKDDSNIRWINQSSNACSVCDQIGRICISICHTLSVSLTKFNLFEGCDDEASSNPHVPQSTIAFWLALCASISTRNIGGNHYRAQAALLTRCCALKYEFLKLALNCAETLTMPDLLCHECGHEAQTEDLGEASHCCPVCDSDFCEIMSTVRQVHQTKAYVYLCGAVCLWHGRF
jgi:hypothetical protein